MKKILSFARSMKFGMILMIMILVLCFIGSIIPQGAQEAQYLAEYGETGKNRIFALALDHVFSSPLFLVVSGLLCVNLTACSVTRFINTLRMKRSYRSSAASRKPEFSLTEESREKLLGFLKQRRFKAVSGGESCIYSRSVYGLWGSFLTHLSILLILASGILVISLADVQEVSLFPGDSAALEDGAALLVSDFRMTDNAGKTDYISDVTLTLPDGSSASKEIRVNEPLRLSRYKVYQSTYGAAGTASVLNNETGMESILHLEEPCFLTLDGVTGVYFQGFYSGYKKDSDGSLMIRTDSGDDYSDPVYVVALIDGTGNPVPETVFPDDEMTVGGVTVTFGPAVYKTGLLVKKMPAFMMGLLYATFGLMVLGLWLCFFTVPVYIRVDKNGFALLSPKPQVGLLFELESEGIIQNQKENH